jgi:hypothetical protein
MRHKRWTVLLLVPLFLAGCGALGPGSSPGSPAGAAGATPSPGASWIVVARGSATPSPRPSLPARTPGPSTGAGFLPIVAVPAPTGTPPPACHPNTFDFSKIGGATVTPGPTSAVVSWYNVGGYSLVQFRLTATSQDVRYGRQRDVGWVTVAPTVACGQMSATVTGLDRRTDYVFTVDAVVRRRSGDGTHAATVARSGVVRTS